ncbi:MAG: hypothetical protein ACI9V1_003340 [Spirosomataceae bacterium]|jgi:hypothetical protein
MLNSDFLNLLSSNYSSAKNCHIKNYKIGIFDVEICFYDIAATEIFTKAISHLEIKNVEKPDFTIHVADSKTKLPKPTWNWNDVENKGEIPTEKENITARFMNWQNTFFLVNHAQSEAFYWTKTVEELPEWERSFPFRDILHNWFRKEARFFILHAAAVGTADGGVIIVGKSGSGKSTSALACIGSELKYAGDDLILVDLQEKIIYSLYNVAKLNFDQAERFPILKSFIFNENTGDDCKAQVFLQDHYPEYIIKEMPLKALIIPKFNGNKKSSWEQTTVAKGVMALSPSTIALMNEEPDYFHLLRKIAEAVPNYQLETGSELITIPIAIKEIIHETIKR